MSVVDELAALPSDLRRRPWAAASLTVAIAALASVPIAIYGGNIAVVSALSLGALAALTNADRGLEGAQ